MDPPSGTRCACLRACVFLHFLASVSGLFYCPLPDVTTACSRAGQFTKEHWLWSTVHAPSSSQRTHAISTMSDTIPCPEGNHNQRQLPPGSECRSTHGPGRRALCTELSHTRDSLTLSSPFAVPHPTTRRSTSSTPRVALTAAANSIALLQRCAEAMSTRT